MNDAYDVGQPAPRNRSVLNVVRARHVSTIIVPPSGVVAPRSIPINCRRVVGTKSLPVEVLHMPEVPPHVTFAPPVTSAAPVAPAITPDVPLSQPSSGTELAHHGAMLTVAVGVGVPTGVPDDVAVAVLEPVGDRDDVRDDVGVFGGVIDGEPVPDAVVDGDAPRE